MSGKDAREAYNTEVKAPGMGLKFKGEVARRAIHPGP
uniref:Uncharacterized protein n=1 Tax=Magnetococcus massalia (strain MO-1) TaxID=451514 RepID=A0A1S7LLB7_MAGMO|nr:protein of unknown function [Candidatus Magnetococcus massalia]